MAFIEFKYGNLDSAEKYSKRGLEIKVKIGDKPGIARSLSQLGSIEEQRSNLDKAQEYFKESLKICEEIGAKSMAANNIHMLGVINAKQGNWGEALKFFLVAIFYFHKIDSGEEKIVMNNIAIVRNILGEDKFQKILEEIKKSDYPSI